MLSREGKPRKFALVSHVLPPSPSGQAVVLSRLLRDLDPQQYCLISVRDYASNTPSAAHDMNPGAITRRLNGRYHSIPPDLGLRLSPLAPLVRNVFQTALRTSRKSGNQMLPGGPGSGAGVPTWRWKSQLRDLVLWVEDLLHLRRQVYRRARHIAKIVMAEDCDAIVGCSGDVVDLPAVVHAARWTKRPFYAYMFDDYAAHCTLPFQKEFAQNMTPRILHHAAGVVVPNEFLARSYRQQYGIEPCIIANPAEDGVLVSPAAGELRVKPPRILYTGAIYEAHFDAFHRLLAAVASMDEPRPDLHIYTSTARRNLEQHRIGAPAIVHDAVSSEEAVRLQRSAEILFLPLAFESPYPEVVNTSAPGKLGELLASGRPILVHAPRESFLSWYFRTHECGLVVDERDPSLLVKAIHRLLLDRALCQRLVARARQCVREDFSLAVSRARFFNMLANPPAIDSARRSNAA
jgi:glycosyltransferase involved in cell wall biosynthesis